MLPNIGAPELIIILIIALVVLGPGRLPDVAQSLGRSVREFRKAATDLSDATKVDTAADAAAQPAATAPATPAAEPNALSGAATPNALEGPAAKPAGDDDTTTPPAA